MDSLFLLKKFIGQLIMPINVIIILLIIALLFYRKKPILSHRSLLIATVLLLLSSTPFVSDKLMYPLEESYPSYVKSDVKIDYIVILGCYHTTDHTLSATSQLRACSLQRVVEALRIYQIHPQAKIITSGSAGHNEESNAEKVKLALIELGVNEKVILTENFPKDTEEEAELIAPRILNKNSILVTNADHMIRSMKYFQSQGVYPIAAPASPWVKDYYGDKGLGYYLPSSKSLQQTTIAWYETAGLFVQWLKSLV